jgi:hypothetical protein
MVTFTFPVIFAHGRASSCSNVNLTECFVYPRTRSKCPSYIPFTIVATSPTLILVASYHHVDRPTKKPSFLFVCLKVSFPASFALTISIVSCISPVGSGTQAVAGCAYTSDCQYGPKTKRNAQTQAICPCLSVCPWTCRLWVSFWQSAGVLNVTA